MATSSGLEDVFGRYLQEIGAVSLLTAEEEVDLSKRAHAGRTAAVMLERGGHDEERAEQLRRIVVLGCRAEDRMARANLRLVVSIAQRHQGRGLDLIDLVQEGNLGLLRAVQKFDHRKGYRFSTYATWWIRQAVSRGVAKRGRTIRLPGRVHDLISRIRRCELDLALQHDRPPTDEEVADATDLTMDRLQEIRRVMGRPVPLDSPVNEDGDTTIGDLIPDESVVPPEVQATDEVAFRTLHEVLGDLDERARRVLEARFGLTGEPMTLASIGDELGVTRERVRQIETSSLERLRDHRRLAGMLPESKIA